MSVTILVLSSSSRGLLDMEEVPGVAETGANARNGSFKSVAAFQKHLKSINERKVYCCTTSYQTY